MGLPVLVLAGPTGAGKSAWAIRLAEQAPVEIVSVDSALVYRGLDIGTAKPSAAERGRIPHHLIDICDPADSYSAGRFVQDALAHIGAIHGRGRVPLLVGGTMLYFRALLRGLAPLPQASAERRRDIDARAVREGWPALHAELARLDPQAAARISPNDPQRIQRALEVCYETGQTLSDLHRQTVSALNAGPVWQWALVPGERGRLHARLESRFYSMLAQGFLEEVRALHVRGDLNASLPAIRAVGYRQLWSHLQGEISLEEATRGGIAATRQLAKRQLTWIRSERSLQWLDPDTDGAEASWNRDVRSRLRELGL
jgi:tRNA dimethylallyltransferase